MSIRELEGTILVPRAGCRWLPCPGPARLSVVIIGEPTEIFRGGAQGLVFEAAAIGPVSLTATGFTATISLIIGQSYAGSVGAGH